MRRPAPTLALLLVAAAGCGGAGGPGAPGRPNVLVLLADDLRHDALSVAGNPYAETPHLDRIAREGALFTRAYVATSRCCPGRASFLTGKLAHRHGVWTNRPEHDVVAEHETVAESLDRAGYDTAWIGKWHLPNPGADPVAGFDHWVSYEGPGDHYDQVFDVDGETVASEGYQADRLTDYALAFLDRERTAPFFLVVAFKNPHVPLTPPPRHAGRLAQVAIEVPASARDPVETQPAFVRKLRLGGGRHEVDWSTWEDDVRAYFELVLSVDDNAGRLLDRLGERGILDETLVVLTTDNGMLLGEHGIDAKGVAFEPSIRVPLALRWPGRILAGSRRRELVLTVDLLPTILGAARLPVPADVDGRSLLGLFGADPPPWREHFLYVLPGFGEQGMVEHAIVEERWKLVVDEAEGRREDWLYDLQNDPEERVNAAGDPANAAVLERLQELMETERARSGT